MSLRKLMFNLLALCLSLAGLACGLLCLLGLIVYLFSRGLGLGSAALALLCLSCLGLAVKLLSRAAKRESKQLDSAGQHSLKTWWPLRKSTGSGSGPSPYRDGLDREVLPPGAVEDRTPYRVAKHRTDDLRPYGKWSEPTDNIGSSQNRDR